MKVNIENAVRHCGAKPGYAFLLSELIRHMKELRDRTDAGDASALGEFLDLYRFDDNQCSERPNTSDKVRR